MYRSIFTGSMDYFVIVPRMLFSVTKLRNILKGSRITVCIISGMLFSASWPKIKFLSSWPNPLHLREDGKLLSRELMTHNKSFFKKKKDYKPKQLPRGYIKVHKLVHLPTEWMCTLLHTHMVFLAVSPGHGIQPRFLSSTLALYFRNKFSIWKEALFGFYALQCLRKALGFESAT